MTNAKSRATNPKSEATKREELGAYKDVFTFYEAGKDRRYNLLFAVNGGVLAIAGLSNGAIVDRLPLRVVAIGMVLFTIIMAIDIWIFGIGMRRRGGDTAEGPDGGMFSWWGRGVLTAICALIVAAWLCVAAYA